MESIINQTIENNLTISPRKVLDIGMQILTSLKVLHSTGYTHNDIKPGNIMLDKISDENSDM